MTELIDHGNFYYADCIATDSSRVMGYRIDSDKIELDDSIIVDESELTSIFQNFSVEIGNSTYSGGEAAAHGSCGFFCKRIGGLLDWILVSTESNPFISVELHKECVRFRTSSGFIWVVPNDKIESVYIENDKLAGSDVKRAPDYQTTNHPGHGQDPVTRVEDA
ncbi:hypothetical protein [Massilia rubra]|uniref:Uncharacterized protein n=1 Tax=Massilia rubra TaxID=2607910 RepID=A0ABX0LLN0_9BURK|nr:hypothetical protein [Massilia rubra]NHZ32464.1 hypothetical protein [Massilia rubra]